jgi:hypothetical protein
MALYALKEVEWREKKSENNLHSETRITSNIIIAKRVQEVGEESTSKEANKKQKIDKVCTYIVSFYIGLSFSQRSLNQKLFDEENNEIPSLVLPTVSYDTAEDNDVSEESKSVDDSDNNVFNDDVDDVCISYYLTNTHY